MSYVIFKSEKNPNLSKRVLNFLKIELQCVMLLLGLWD